MEQKILSPWGIVEKQEIILEGIYHIIAYNANGGIMIHQDKANQFLSSYAQKCCFHHGEYLCYEKPFQEPIILYELKKKGISISGFSFNTNNLVERIKRYNPKYWDEKIRMKTCKFTKRKANDQHER